MSIIRRKRTENYTIVPNHIWDDEYISFEAKSLLVYLLSRPNDWKVNTKHLQGVMGYGRNKVQRIVTTLVERGYMERHTIKGKDGQFAGQELVVFDEVDKDIPHNYEQPESTEAPFGGDGSRGDGKQCNILSTDFLLNTELNNICRFEEFWDALGDKRGKPAALKVWKSKKLNTKADEIIKGARAYVKIRGDDKRYWKMPQGWLNDGRWTDESNTSGQNSQTQRTAFGDIPDNTHMSPEDIQRKAGMIQ